MAKLPLLAVTALSVLLLPMPSQALSTPTIDKILARGEIVIGHRVASAPFGYVADDGSVTGYSVEICKFVADEIKQALGRPDLKTRFVPADPSNRIPLVQNGTIDMECAGTGNTLARQKVVSFTLNTIYTETLIAVRKSGPIDSVKDLKGMKVAVPQGTVQQKMLADLSAKMGLDITPVMAKDAAEVFLLLETGRADGALNDPILLSTFIHKSSTPNDFMFLPDWSAPPEAVSIMITQGDDKFRSLANAGIKKMMDTGKFAANYDRWFMVPPYNLPMSDALKAQIANPNDKGT